MNLIQLRQRFHEDVVITKSIFFILGLILSYKLVEKTFLNILITHLTNAWEVDDLRRAAVVVNLQEGTSSVLVPVFAYVADVYTGRFKMVVCSAAVCIIGLVLNCLAAGNDEQLEFGLFYSALGLMTLAEAALTVMLRAFLDDQLRPSNQTPAAAKDDDTARDQLRPRDVTPTAAAANDDSTARNRRSGFWWNSVSFVAAIFALFGPLPGLEFRKLAIVLTALMGGCFIVFLLGTKYYILVDTIENPFKDVGIVIVRAIANRKVEYPQTPEGLLDNSSGDLHILPHVPWLRWLDRAAIVQEMEARPSTVEQVRRVKLLLKMLPLWSSFLTLSLVAASGSTFFFEEASSIANDLRPILFFANLMTFTEFVVSEISSFLLRKLRKKYKVQKMELVRIGIGMSCCVPCCIAAWVTATRRQHDDQGNMSVYWLTPQYFLLGLMGGLSQDGFQSFYESQVSESLSRFGPPFGELMMGVGKFMSILCILILSRRPFKWFEIKLDYSRLDKYYILLAVLSFGNVIIYCLVASWYRDDAFLVEDEEMGTIAQLQAIDQLVEGVASRSIEGQHISHPSLSHRTVSKERESSSGDIITESSSSRQEEETPEDSTKNISTYNYVLLRAVTMFSRLSSRAARKRSDSTTLLKKD